MTSAVERSRSSSHVTGAGRAAASSVLWLLLAASSLASSSTACRPGSTRHATHLEGAVMGTTWTATVVTEHEPATAWLQDLEASIQAALDDVDTKMSTYKPDSEISRFARHDSFEPMPVSQETWFVVRETLHIAAASGGALDPTVAPLVDLWGFGPSGGRATLPSEQEIDTLLETIGWRGLEATSDGQLAKSSPTLALDLSAVAKGYAVDRAAKVLHAAGATDFLMEVGGEITTRGRNPDGDSWRLAIETPTSEPVGGRSVHTLVAVSGLALATSGDYRNQYEVDGVRYSHTLDPRTGRPITHRLASVSVLAERALEADGWATALNVLGPESGPALAEQIGLAALFLTYESDPTEGTAVTLDETTTTRWRQIVGDGSGETPS